MRYEHTGYFALSSIPASTLAYNRAYVLFSMVCFDPINYHQQRLENDMSCSFPVTSHSLGLTVHCLKLLIMQYPELLAYFISYVQTFSLMLYVLS
jgi:hypothetical protein